MNDILENLALLIQNSIWLAPLIAFVAGILASFSPCCLATTSLTIAFVGSSTTDTKKAFRLSLVLASGMAITYFIMGILAMFIGNIIKQGTPIWYFVAGIVMILMALQTWEIITIIPPTYLNSKNHKRGYIGALIAGILMGVFASPCATPIIVILLTMVANSNSFSQGCLLLLLYSIGNGILTIVIGTATGFIKKISRTTQYGIFSKISKIALGIISLLFGLYMLYLAF
jgi:cytochrome c biogenesis protein CcdA